MKELIFQKGFILIKQTCQKNVIFVTIGILKSIGFKYEPYLCNGCHDLIQKAMSFSNMAIVDIKGDAYRTNFWYMSKDDAINIMNGSIVLDKRSVLYIFLLYIKMSENTNLTYHKKKLRRNTK